jgi:hypothetical protein
LQFGQRRVQPADDIAVGVRAEAVPGVPVDQRARLGEDRRLARRHQRRERADVDVLDLGRCRRAARIDRETGAAALGNAEKDAGRAGRDRVAPRRELLPVEGRTEHVRDRRFQIV